MARRAASTSATEQLVERVGDWLIVRVGDWLIVRVGDWLSVRAALWTQLANLPGFQIMYEPYP